MTFLKSLTWMQIYHRKAMLAHHPMIMIVSGYTFPDRVPWRTLTVWSGCPPLCVRIPVPICQRKVCLPLVIFFHLWGDRCFLKLYPDHVHWYVTCCSWVWVQPDDDFRPDAHWTEGCGCLPLCHCGIFDPVFLCAEFRGGLNSYMEDPTVVGKFSAFSVKAYIPLLKDACASVLLFRSSGVPALPQAKKKFAYNQLKIGCVQVCVITLVNVQE